MRRVNPSAGVYTLENDMSVRASAASTSIVAVVGEAGRGPVGVPTDIFDDTDLLAKFGHSDARLYGFGLYSAQRALSGTNNLKYVRVVSEDALTAGAYLTVDDITEPYPHLALTVFDDGSNNALGMKDPMANHAFQMDDPATENTMAFFCANSPGSWSKELTIKIVPSAPAGISLDEERHYNPFHFAVEVYVNYLNANSRPVERFVVSRNYEVNGDGDQMFIEDVINTYSAYIQVRNNPHCPPVKIKKEAMEFLDGGADGTRPHEGLIRKGWDLFEDAEVIDVNLLCNAGYTTASVQRHMLTLAEKRGDCIAILDLPRASHETARAVHYVMNDLNYSSSYGGMYAPYLVIRDTNSAKEIAIPPSGDVCAAMAYTDQVAAVWFAAAGLRRGKLKVLSIVEKYKKGARNSLDRAKVNVIRNLPGRGFVIMGQDTLQRHDSAVSNINVRRMMNMIKKTLANAATISNFDPQDDITRTTLRSICNDFLRPIKAGRGLHEFETVCDTRNNPPDVVANGDLVLDVYADPTIPSKRIHLNAHLMPTGTYFNEE